MCVGTKGGWRIFFEKRDCLFNCHSKWRRAVTCCQRLLLACANWLFSHKVSPSPHWAADNRNLAWRKKNLGFFFSISKISYHYWLFALSFSRNCGFYIKSKTFAISLDSRYYEIPTSVVLYLKQKYWVILKKVSFGIFRTILVSKEEKNFTIKSKDKGLSLSKFS